MGQLRQVPRFTIEQYLLLERSGEERHEFLDGIIYGMAGESLAHGDISINLVILIGNQLKGRPCRVLSKDTKILSGPDHADRLNDRGLFSYPDLVVVCGDPEFLDDKRDVILNPKVIIEVLSPSTESFDRVEKCQRYQKYNPTLTDYLLVAQDRPEIERHNRQADGGWLVHRHVGLDAAIDIPEVDCRIPLRDVYDRVSFSLRA
jgi:Uma2 family endonuclease